MRYEARFLGVPELLGDGETVAFPFLKARILALILIEERRVSRDKLCSLLWGNKTLEAARRNLSNALSCVRGVFPLFSENRDILSLPPEVRIVKDLDDLDRLVALPWPRVEGLFRPFMDLAELEDWDSFDEWLLPKRESYRALLTRMLQERVRCDLARPEPSALEDAVLCQERIAELQPYDETVHGALVRLYIKAGRKVDAVRTARSFAGRIERELGIRSDLSVSHLLLKRRKTSRPDAASPLSPTENPLERTQETLQMLDFFCSHGETGRSSCGFLWGEEGIGKGSFIQDILSHLSRHGWDCRSVRFSQEERNRPMVPFIQMLRKRDPRLLEEEKNLPFTDLVCSQVAERVYQEVATKPGEAPKLFVLENVQWMDEASWMIVETILWDHSCPRHILVSGYGEARGTFLARTSCAEEPFATCEIVLERFAPPQTAQICRHLRPDKEWTESETRRVYDQTEGNPFFIRELLCPPPRKPEESTALRRSKNPFADRVELLPQEERSFLEVLALCPGPVSLSQAAAILGLSPLDVARIYDRIRLYGFLREKNEGNGDVSYYFTHLKIREALVDRMSESLRVALHLRNLEILQRGGPPSPLYRNRQTYRQLAWHAGKANLSEEELRWRMGELQLHFQAAHEVFPALSDPDLSRHIPAAEDFPWTQSALEETRTLLDRLVRERGQSSELLRRERDWTILKGGHLWWSGDYEGSAQLLTEGLRLALRSREGDAVAAATGQLCYLAIQRDDGDRLLFWARRLYRLAAAERRNPWLGTALRFLAIAHILKGCTEPVNRLLQMSSRYFEKQEEIGPSYTVSLIAAEHFRGDLELAGGRAAEALGHYVNCIRMGECLSLYPGLGLSRAKAAFCALLLDDAAEARAFLNRMLKPQTLCCPDRRNALQGGGFAFSLMGLLEALENRWEASAPCFDAAQELAGRKGRPTWTAILCWSKGELLRQKGDIPREFRERYLPESQEWYEGRSAKLRDQIGWRTG